MGIEETETYRLKRWASLGRAVPSKLHQNGHSEGLPRAHAEQGEDVALVLGEV